MVSLIFETIFSIGRGEGEGDNGNGNAIIAARKHWLSKSIISPPK
jgi:hypothetical protein